MEWKPSGTHTLRYLFPPYSLTALVIMLTGLFTLQPNEARVLVLFGKYKGTVRTSGFHWGNPFYSNGPMQVGSLHEGGPFKRPRLQRPHPVKRP